MVTEFCAGDRIRLNSGTVVVADKQRCGSLQRRDVIYSFVGTELRLTGREIELNVSLQHAR